VSLGGSAFQGRWGFLGSGERWCVVSGEAETTAAVHEHQPVCLKRLRIYFVDWMPAPTGPRKHDSHHQLRPRFVSPLLVNI